MCLFGLRRRSLATHAHRLAPHVRTERLAESGDVVMPLPHGGGGVTAQQQLRDALVAHAAADANNAAATALPNAAAPPKHRRAQRLFKAALPVV